MLLPSNACVVPLLLWCCSYETQRLTKTLITRQVCIIGHFIDPKVGQLEHGSFQGGPDQL
jgi:hypothetical protein